jgi:hypothetical protein
VRAATRAIAAVPPYGGWLAIALVCLAAGAGVLGNSRNWGAALIAIGLLCAVFAVVSEKARQREALAEECHRLGADMGAAYKAHCFRHPAGGQAAEDEFFTNYVERFFQTAKRLYETLGPEFAEDSPRPSLFSPSVAAAILQPANAAEVGWLSSVFRDYAKRLRGKG